MATLERVTEELQLANEYSDLILDQEVSIDQSQVIMNKKLDDVCYELIKHTSLLSMLTQDIANLKMKEYYRGADNLDNETTGSQPAPRPSMKENDGGDGKQGWAKRNLSKGYQQGQQFESVTKRARKRAELGLQNVGEVFGTASAIVSPVTNLFRNKEEDLTPSEDYMEETNEKLDEVVEAVHGVSDAIRQDQKREEFVDRRDARLAKRERTGASRGRSTAGPRGIFTGMAGMSMLDPASAKSGLLGGLLDLAGDAAIATGLGSAADALRKPVPTPTPAPEEDGKDKNKKQKAPKPARTTSSRLSRGAGPLAALLGLIDLTLQYEEMQAMVAAGEMTEEEMGDLMTQQGAGVAGMLGGAALGAAAGAPAGPAGAFVGGIIGAFLGEAAVENIVGKFLGIIETETTTRKEAQGGPNNQGPQLPEGVEQTRPNTRRAQRDRQSAATAAETANVNQQMKEYLDYQQVMNTRLMDESTTNSANVSMVNAPSSNTNVVNNTNVQPGQIVISDPTDKTQANYKR